MSRPRSGRYLRWKRNIILFPFQVVTPESADPASKRWPLYNSALLNRTCGSSHKSAVCRTAPRELLRVSRKETGTSSRVNDLCCAMSNYRPGDASANGYGVKTGVLLGSAEPGICRALWHARQWVNVRAGNPAVVDTYVP